MADPLIQIVDEQDRPVGAATRREAWQKGLRHRIVFVVVQDTSGRMLLQKRSKNMKLWPGRWTVAASGHVDAGEDYDTAAKRELAEEIGIKGVKLETLGTFPYEGKYEDKRLVRFDKVYKVTLPGDTAFNLQATEVTETRWFGLEGVRDLATKHPEKVSPILTKIVNDYYS